jgi:hypothetical protein
MPYDQLVYVLDVVDLGVVIPPSEPGCKLSFIGVHDLLANTALTLCHVYCRTTTCTVGNMRNVPYFAKDTLLR